MNADALIVAAIATTVILVLLVVVVSPVCVIAGKALQPIQPCPKTTLKTVLAKAKTGDIFLIDAPKFLTRIKLPPLLSRPARNRKGNDIGFTHVGVLVRAASGKLLLYSSTSGCRNAPACSNAVSMCQCENLQLLTDVMDAHQGSRYAWRQLSRPVPDEKYVRSWADSKTHPLRMVPRSVTSLLCAWLGIGWFSRLGIREPESFPLLCSGTSFQLLQAAGVGREDDRWLATLVAPHDFGADDCSWMLKKGWAFGPIMEVNVTKDFQKKNKKKT